MLIGSLLLPSDGSGIPSLPASVELLARGRGVVAKTGTGRVIMADNPNPFSSVEDGRLLAQAIVDTIREPLLVLDKELRVVAASRAFYSSFQMGPHDVEGRPIYALGNG